MKKVRFFVRNNLPLLVLNGIKRYLGSLIDLVDLIDLILLIKSILMIWEEPLYWLLLGPEELILRRL